MGSLGSFEGAVCAMRGAGCRLTLSRGRWNLPDFGMRKFYPDFIGLLWEMDFGEAGLGLEASTGVL